MSKGKWKLFKLNDDNSLAKIPQYRESYSRNGWIDFGDDNNLPNYYASLLSRSGIHAGVVKGKGQMIGGYGFEKNDISNQLYAFLRNPYGECDMEEILARLSLDLETFGAFCLKIVWNKARTAIAQIEWISPMFIRIGVPDPNYPQIECYYHCEDWSIWRKKGVTKYPGFSVTDRKEAHQILYVKEYKPSRAFYGEPEYISGVNWIEMEYEISNFHLNNIKRGFAPSMIINFPNGIPSDEEMGFTIRQMKSQYEGSHNAGEIMFTFSEDKDRAPSITPVETNDNDGKFIQLKQDLTEGIMSAHRVVNPEIFSIMREGGLISNQSDILNSIELFQSLYVTPKQNMIERELNRLIRVNGIEDKLKISEYKVKFSKMDLSISDLLSILQSTISSSQKIAILTSSGYELSEATKLVIDNELKNNI